ncbi:MAG: hypothetical protein IT438_06880 [Phycisphaerales bacterium]|nr:hypothetical protein [Phycisphaerales bacterium]
MPNHPPLDQIPPMPMPVDDDIFRLPASDTVTMHDAMTGVTVELPSALRSGLEGGGGSGFDGADGRVLPSELMRSLGAMTPVTTFTAFPERANCALAMRFTDQTGATRWFSCSGAMQDSGVVLTAAHCVYARSVDGPDIYDWADEIWIYPGWDGIGTAGNTGTAEVIQAWGWTRGTQYIAGTAWINDGDFNRDCAAIRVDRGANRMVGMLTGWYGYAWGYGCSESLGRTYYNYSYPAEACGTPGLHTGRTLYFRSGHFDWPCPGNRLQTSTSPGCLAAVWGGMSGSNAYFFANATERWAHAVCSTSDRYSYGRYCKLWEQFTVDLNTFRSDARGTVFDLESLRFRLNGSATVQASTATSACTVTLVNATDADPPSASYTARVYLSNNSTITPSDTLVGTFAFSHDFAPMEAVPLNLNGGVTIPPSATPGDWWLGVILDPASDVVPQNNASNSWDAQPITVTAAPPPPPSNDACANALARSVGITTFGSTSNATGDGSATCGGSAGPDVWYRVFAPLTGSLRIDTCGSLYDTVLSVHSACPGTTANQIGCNDDHGAGAVGCPNLRDSAVAIPVVGGYTYWVRLAGFQGTTGGYALSTAYVAPSNDDCANAAPYGVGQTVQSTLAGATNDGSASCGQSAAGADAWYRLVAPQTGNLRVDTCGSGFDTVLSIHSACPGPFPSQVACNDDAPTGTCTAPLPSALDVGVIAGNAYLIRVSGYAGAVGYFTLRSGYIAPANDTCAGAVGVSPGTSLAGITSGASVDGSSGCGVTGSAPDVWYRLDPSCAGLLRIDTCGSSFDTVLSVHSGCPGTSANQLACNDDHGNGGAGGCAGLRDSALQLAVTPGSTYWIRVSGFNGASGALLLLAGYVAGVAADACEDAPIVPDGTYPFTTCGAVTDGPMEGQCGFGFGDLQVNRDLWLRYDAPTARRVQVDTCASAAPSLDTKLAVYSAGEVGMPVACPGADNTAIACSDDVGSGCGASLFLSRTVFVAGAGRSYLVRVGGYLGGAGTGAISIASFCIADFNTDGSVSVQDIFDFLTAYFQGLSSADINGEGGVTVQDIFDYLSSYFIGC